MEKPIVLLIEDDPTYQTLIKESIYKFNWILSGTIKDGRNYLQSNFDKIAAVIVDINLPDGDGLRFLNEIMSKENFRKIPCLVLTGESHVGNKITAFSIGAEDFIEKPFDSLELEARLSAKIRKSQIKANEETNFKIKNLYIDLNRQKAFHITDNHGEVDLDLTVKELRILLLLTKNMERVYSRDQILDKIWPDISISDRTVDSHISHLRKKISAVNIDIKSLKGIGYSATVS